MDIFIIKEYDFREEYRFLASCLTLSAFMHFKKRNTCHLLELLCSKSKSYSYKWIIPSGRSDCIQLILNPLPSLVKISADFVKRILDRTFFTSCPALVRVFHKFLDIFIVTLLCIRCKDLVYFRYCESAILLRSSAQDNITHNIKRSIQCLRLIVPYISHLKSAAEYRCHIKETAVHGIQTRRLVMNIDITVSSRLPFFNIQKEFIIQVLVQLTINQTALCTSHSRISVGI